MKELNIIQTKLVADKSLHNEFSNFDYRSLESIMNSVKPLLKETGCTLTFTDELVMVGERYYIKSTATITNEKGEVRTSCAYAREQAAKKGMDEAQITGAASSYARKYAACSLLGISDGWDPDAMDNRQEGQNGPQGCAGNKGGASSSQAAIRAAKAAKSRQELDAVWAKYPQLHTDAAFLAACNERAAAL